ncbi:MAG TPA: WS/DGAT domain-containing protein [Mycobacterium sp.]|nr:WS/DGAT domain-containing protein [Mycobacterium sp.]HKI41026.1 WS/DGAT domain-containing protein [Mycobacterium sp.]
MLATAYRHGAPSTRCYQATLALQSCCRHIAILSYANDPVFGIIADYDATPDVDELAQGVEQAVARLDALSTAARRSKRALTLPAGRS